MRFRLPQSLCGAGMDQFCTVLKNRMGTMTEWTHDRTIVKGRLTKGAVVCGWSANTLSITARAAA